jgi:hypothetical protein
MKHTVLPDHFEGEDEVLEGPHSCDLTDLDHPTVLMHPRYLKDWVLQADHLCFLLHRWLMKIVSFTIFTFENV